MDDQQTSGRWIPRPDESTEQYRLRMIEDRLVPIEGAVREILRLRRDGGVAVVCIVLVIGLTSPGVWGLLEATLKATHP